jgi:hypothetical protein
MDKPLFCVGVSKTAQSADLRGNILIGEFW